VFEYAAQHLQVDGLVGVPVHGDVTTRIDVAGALAFLADHGDEAAQLDPVRAHPVGFADEGDRACSPSPAAWYDEPTTNLELVPPSGRDVPGADLSGLPLDRDRAKPAVVG
jgi:hypothetical protein